MERPVNRTERYTYGDYLKWPDGERWELIEGRAYALTPGPSTDHQQVSVTLTALLYSYFRGKPCRALAAPLDVRLPSGDETDEAVETLVQPDLLVVCDPAKIDKKGVRGAPDLVVEILSGSTSERDLGEKLRLYETHGVRCYIIVDPWGKSLTIRYLDANKQYARPEFFAGNDHAPIRIFEGLVLDLAQIFEYV